MRVFSNHGIKRLLGVGLAMLLIGGLSGCNLAQGGNYDEEAVRAELYEMGFGPRYLEWNLILDKTRERINNAKAIEVDLTKSGAITDIRETGGEVTGFTLHVSKDKAIPMEAQGVTIDEDGSLRFAENGYICSLAEIEGLYAVGLKGAEEHDGVECKYGVSPADLLQVASSEDLLFTTGSWSGLNTEEYLDFENPGEFGYFRVNAAVGYGEMPVAAIRFYADGEHHGIGKVTLYTDFYGWLREGDYYDTSREVFNPDLGIYDFYLLCYSDVEGAEHDVYISSGIAGIEDYVIGDLHAEDGSVKAKSDPLALGDYLDVAIKGVTVKVELPICPSINPESMHAGALTSTFPATGDLNVLVVPIYYADQAEHLDSDMEVILDTLGNVVLADGSVQNRDSAAGTYTLSDYFAQSSYGKLNITSYVTDWYMVSENDFADCVDSTLRDEEAFAMQTWVNENYSSWKGKLDANADDIYDAVIVVCATAGYEREYYTTISVGGAVTMGRAYGHWYAHDGETAINKYVQVSADMFYKKYSVSDSGLWSNVLIHEMGHGFGLIDYYDVYYSGYNAVGGYDMQSDNYGDWNPYSKFAAGWITPTVLTAEDIGDGTTVTISRFTQTGDALVLPTEKTQVNADGTVNPFSEYIMVDLFSPDGLNTYDAPEYELTDTGVRIYHIDARVIQIDLKKDWMEDGYTYDVLYANAYKDGGKYHVNLLQSSGENTFTAGEYRTFSNEDLFKEGDSFSIEKQSYAFDHGKMNDGSEFPYSITVISLTEDEAVIEIKPLN